MTVPDLDELDTITEDWTDAVTGALNRRGCTASRVGQSFPNVTTSDVVLDTAVVDPDGMVNTSTGVITIPVDGLWAVAAWCDANAGMTSSFLRVEINGTRFDTGPAGNDILTASHGPIPLSAGHQIRLQVYNGSGASKTINAVVHCYRVGI